MPEKIIIAKVFVINNDGLILTIRRSKTDPRRPLTWDLPGGTVEYGEDPNVTAARELKEETGLQVDNLKIFDVVTTNDQVYVTRLLYHSKVSNQTIQLSYEHDQSKWVTKNDFDKLDAPEYFKQALKHLPD